MRKPQFSFPAMLLALCLTGCCDYEQYKKPYGDDCVQLGGLYRCWNIHVPEGLEGSVPLVIDLHGLGSSPARQRNLSGIDELADSEGFIAVWPHGICEAWNAGRRCCGAAAQDHVDDVTFIREMVEQVSAQHEIDASRIYVTGLSNGCAQAQRLANEASDLVAATACMSLYLLGERDPDYTPVPVMTLMGKRDDLYFPGEYLGAMENFETWRRMNGCTGDYTETWSSGDSYAWTYEHCNEGADVSLVTIADGGHVLYQGEETEIDTTLLAWEFMSRFSN